MTSRRYDAVLLDAGDTLVHPSPTFGVALAGILRERGHEVEEDAAEHHGREVLTKAVGTAMSERVHWTTSLEESTCFWTAVYERLLGRLEVPDPEGKIAALLYEEFSKPERYGLFPDALPALRELASHEYRLAVVSNWEHWLEELLRVLGVAPLLETAIVSGSFGVEKPDPRIFVAALEKMEVAPERAVYVGDSLAHDIKPALALGMGAVLVDRHDRYTGEYHGVPLVQSLEQVAAVLT